MIKNMWSQSNFIMGLTLCLEMNEKHDDFFSERGSNNNAALGVALFGSTSFRNILKRIRLRFRSGHSTRLQFGDGKKYLRNRCEENRGNASNFKVIFRYDIGICMLLPVLPFNLTSCTINNIV